MIDLIFRKLFDFLSWVLKTILIIGGIAFLGFILFNGIGLIAGLFIGGYVHYILSKE